MLYIVFYNFRASQLQLRLQIDSLAEGNNYFLIKLLLFYREINNPLKFYEINKLSAKFLFLKYL